MPKGVYPTNFGKKPREYPPDIIAAVKRMYIEEGMTVVEVQRALPAGFKAQRIIERHVPQRRVAAKRDQSGERNPMWKGDSASYAAFHLRVQAQRGTPSHCAACDTTDADKRYEWANLTGRYEDVNDFIRLCAPCHRKFDARRRKELGRPLSAHVRNRGDVDV